jgi:hypothetical protein
MADDEPRMARTGAFRSRAIGVEDRELGDHRAGFLEADHPSEAGRADAVAPPRPDRDAPQISLAERLRNRVETGN